MELTFVSAGAHCARPLPPGLSSYIGHEFPSALQPLLSRSVVTSRSRKTLHTAWFFPPARPVLSVMLTVATGPPVQLLASGFQGHLAHIPVGPRTPSIDW